MTVTAATGVCAPDVGEVTTLPITITQTGSSAPWGLSATGFDGLASNTLAGTLSATNQVTLSGSYPEDGGTTTASHQLTLTNATTLTGTEFWSWSGPGGTCPNSQASVMATKNP
ncbi:MAG: hypothetical protein R3B35_01365 [Gemmatimonadales bacterium]